MELSIVFSHPALAWREVFSLLLYTAWSVADSSLDSSLTCLYSCLLDSHGRVSMWMWNYVAMQ